MKGLWAGGATAFVVFAPIIMAASGGTSAPGTEYVVSGFSRTSAQAGRSVKSGVYTIDQARRGREHYRKRCILCHLDNGQGRAAEPEIVGQSLEREGDAEAPPVAGAPFLTKWNGKTAGALYDLVRKTMPVGSAGSLSEQEYADVLAYLFELSKVPAGQQELPSTRDQLDLITIER
jgi:cytochrome c